MQSPRAANLRKLKNWLFAYKNIYPNGQAFFVSSSARAGRHGRLTRAGHHDDERADSFGGDHLHAERRTLLIAPNLGCFLGEKCAIERRAAEITSCILSSVWPSACLSAAALLRQLFLIAPAELSFSDCQRARNGWLIFYYFVAISARRLDLSALSKNDLSFAADADELCRPPCTNYTDSLRVGKVQVNYREATILLQDVYKSARLIIRKKFTYSKCVRNFRNFRSRRKLRS